MITADEEAGGGLGARWLCEQHPDKVRATSSSTRAAATSSSSAAGGLYTLSVGEKGIFRMKLRAHGQAGHASVPRDRRQRPAQARSLHRSPLRAAARRRRRRRGEALLEALLGEPFTGEEGIRAGLERLRAEQPLIADFLVEPMLGVTLTPTIAQGGQEGERDPLRGRGADRLPRAAGIRRGRGARGAAGADRRGRLQLEFSEAVVGNSSPLDSPLADAIGEWLGEADPGAGIAPIVMPGFSDSNSFRTAFPDAVVYGFCPHREIGLLESAPLIHGADERVPVSDVELSAGFFYELSRRMLA